MSLNRENVKEKTEISRNKRAEKYWSKWAPGGKWDYIIIGAGMSGMTLGALLSKLGRRVLLLEQHFIPGGFTQTFRRGNFKWDVGVHLVGKVSEDYFEGRLMSFLSGGELKWTFLGDVYDKLHFSDGFTFDIPADPKAYLESLKEKFPHQSKEIDRYFRTVKKTSDAMGLWFIGNSSLLPRPLDRLLKWFAGKEKNFYNTTEKVLQKLRIEEPQLWSILTSQWGYYGDPPSRSAFSAHSVVVDHFLEGAYYPSRGSDEIARTFLRTVAQAGGWTKIRADVEEIIIRKGRAVGVRLAGGEEFFASKVVSTAGAINTFERMIPPIYRKPKIVDSLRKIPPSVPHIALYMGFEGDISEAGVSSSNLWFFNGSSPREQIWRWRDWKEIPRPPAMFCSFPSLKGERESSDGVQYHTGEVICFTDYELFERWKGSKWKRRGEEYEELKELLSQKILETIFEFLPKLKSKLVYRELSTPLSSEYFCRALRGSIYGLSHTPQRFKNPYLRPKTYIPGLYLSGCDVAVAGVMGAFISALFTALSVEPFGMVKLLAKV